MTEASQSATAIQTTTENRPQISFGDVLKTGREAGREQRRRFFASIKEKITQFKDSAKERWDSFRDTSRKVGETVEGAFGAVSTQKGREMLAAYGRQEIHHAGEVISGRYHEARTAVGEKVAQLSDMARAEFDKAKTDFNEKTLPAIKKGTKVAGVIATAPIWVPAIVGAAAIESAAEGAKFVGGKIAEGAQALGEKGVQLIEAGKEKGRELAGKVNEYVTDRVADVHHELRIAKAGVSEILDQLAVNAAATETKADDIIVGVLQAPETVARKIAEGIRWFKDRLTQARSNVEEKRNAAEARRRQREQQLTAKRILKAELIASRRGAALVGAPAATE